jgi:hypothetical protein
MHSAARDMVQEPLGLRELLGDALKVGVHRAQRLAGRPRAAHSRSSIPYTT